MTEVSPSTPDVGRCLDPAVGADDWITLDLDELPWLVRVHMPRQLIDGHFQMLGICLEPRVNSRQVNEMLVTPESFRSIRVGRLRQMAAAIRAGDLTALSERTRSADREGRSWPTEHFQDVADTYLRALALRLAPTASIMREWGVSRAAASKWVRTARELGFLGFPEKQGIAGSNHSTPPTRSKGAKK